MPDRSPYPQPQEYPQVTNRPGSPTIGDALTWLRDFGRFPSPLPIPYPTISTLINLQQPERVINGEPWIWWSLGALAYFGLNAIVSPPNEAEVVN